MDSPSRESTRKLAIAGLLLAGSSLVVPLAVIPALIVGTLLLVRSRVATGLAVICLAVVLAAGGSFAYYSILDSRSERQAKARARVAAKERQARDEARQFQQEREDAETAIDDARTRREAYETSCEGALPDADPFQTPEDTACQDYYGKQIGKTEEEVDQAWIDGELP